MQKKDLDRYLTLRDLNIFFNDLDRNTRVDIIKNHGFFKRLANELSFKGNVCTENEIEEWFRKHY